MPQSVRAILVVIGSHGDVLPFIGLAVELRRRGYEVVLATTEPYAHLAARQNLETHVLATSAEVEALLARPDLWSASGGVRLLLRAAMHLLGPVYDFVMRNHVPDRTITVASSLALGARIAQERHAIRLATVHVAPFLIRSHFATPRMPGLPMPVWLPRALRANTMAFIDRRILDPLCAPVNHFRAELGLTPTRGIMRWWLHSRERVICMFPPWYAAPQPDWPAQVRQVGFPLVDCFGDTDELDLELQRFLEDRARPVAFTFGSKMVHGQRLLDAALAHCRAFDRRGVIISPQDFKLPADLAGRVFLTSYAPFSKLLPRCAALVHHGGIGTVASAMAAGVPQLLVPLAFDHFDEARHVRALGIGRSLSRALFTPALIDRPLCELVRSPDVRQRCDEVAARMRSSDGVKQAGELIARMLPALKGTGRAGPQPASASNPS